MTLLTERDNIHVTKVENHVATRMNSDDDPENGAMITNSDAEHNTSVDG